MKRMFDIAISLMSLVLLIPFFLIIGLSIKLNSEGPIIFKQKRVGKYGKTFILYKFRSMTVFEYAKEGVFEPGNISRITSVGKFIRRNKLDELPQLFNVLIGDMSIVGPRPEVEKWVDVCPDKWKRILTVTPGITDNASIEFKSEESFLANSENPEKTYREIILPKKLELYEYYVSNHSFCGDLVLIFKTLYHIFLKIR
jgi:lipopolysaccharide/colanic/teichoic acid biosynthesis glycosyltransferase